ncbi:MAG: methyltransferase domain-containing protein [Epsilonproteobacteria bacterium]|nr:methyltransferase domain-containing protein [Campylobacterota bacterium]
MKFFSGLLLSLVVFASVCGADPEYHYKNSDHQKKSAQDALQKLGDLSQYKNILEVECRSGKTVTWIAHQAPESFVVGIDRSKEYIDFCQAMHCAKNLAFVHAAIEKSCEVSAAEQFDLVFCHASLQYFPDHKAALQGMARNLKPGGLLQIKGACYYGDEHPLVKAFNVVKQSAEWKGVLAEFEPSKLANYINPERLNILLVEADCEVNECEQYVQEVPFDSLNDFAAWFKGFVGQAESFSKLPGAMRDALLAAIFIAYDEQLKALGIKKGDGSFVYTVPAVRITATKK